MKIELSEAKRGKVNTCKIQLIGNHNHDKLGEYVLNRLTQAVDECSDECCWFVFFLEPEELPENYDAKRPLECEEVQIIGFFRISRNEHSWYLSHFGVIKPYENQGVEICMLGFLKKYLHMNKFIHKLYLYWPKDGARMKKVYENDNVERYLLLSS